jgi:hypothetical protein
MYRAKQHTHLCPAFISKTSPILEYYEACTCIYFFQLYNACAFLLASLLRIHQTSVNSDFFSSFIQVFLSLWALCSRHSFNLDLVETGYGKKFEKIDYLLHSSVTYACNSVVELAMASTSYKEHERFPYLRTHDSNDITECMKLIVIHSQLWTISSISFSQYVTNQMDIRVSSKHLFSLEVNLVTVGPIFPVKNTEVRSWTVSPLNEVLQGRNLEKFVRILYL